MRALLVWPHCPPCFWTFNKYMEMVGWKAPLPPLGLITVAALCPPHWELRLVDENVEPLRDEDIRWADLVMVSAMHVQRDGVERILARARELGRRTVIGGPYATSNPELVRDRADHLVLGEPDHEMLAICRDLEAGTARHVYEVKEKPDVTLTPVPRFDLLKRDMYSSMAIQFSRGCPFQCEFCDIITLYGRKPRTKEPAQVLAELDALRRLGWNREIFLVDDNFIGNHHRATLLLAELIEWQKRNGYPFSFFTEASVNLAARPDMIRAMGEANFHHVFLGIESPSQEALQETRKFQNLKEDLLTSIRTIQAGGLWVMGGFIVGFDSDDAGAFERQRQFVELAAVPWAMVVLLQALPNTALHTRLSQEGRLLADPVFAEKSLGALNVPNFRTNIPLDVLMEGYRTLVRELYSPRAYFQRVLRSLEVTRPHPSQVPPRHGLWEKVRVVACGLWGLGVRSPHRVEFWKAFLGALGRWWRDPMRCYHAFVGLMSGVHFFYISERLDEELGELVGRLHANPELAAV